MNTEKDTKTLILTEILAEIAEIAEIEEKEEKEEEEEEETNNYTTTEE